MTQMSEMKAELSVRKKELIFLSKVGRYLFLIVNDVPSNCFDWKSLQEFYLFKERYQKSTERLERKIKRLTVSRLDND